MAVVVARGMSEQLEAIAARVHDLAFDAAETDRGHSRTDWLIDAVEQAAADLRAIVRGRG